MSALMSPKTEAPERVRVLLADYFAESAKVRPMKEWGVRDDVADFSVAVGSKLFVVDVSTEASIPRLVSSLARLATSAAEQKSLGKTTFVYLVVVPFMGPSGKEFCRNNKLNWLDLSGNADIQAGNLRILVEGRPNLFQRVGRPSSFFTPKASRISRWFLTNGEKSVSQKQLCEGTRLSKGYVSTVLRGLKKEALVREEADGYRAVDRELLLKAWAERYDFSRHRVIKGAMPVRSGQDAIERISRVLGPRDYAATGLAGAWYLDHFAMFRTATVYLAAAPTAALFSDLSFMEGERGANTWLVLPNDEGVFDRCGVTDEGVNCAHWVQVYLDLAGHPERSKEAAEHLKQTHQHWGSHA
jgi:hypothetical protein